jgi:hypothetical protein
MRQFLCGILLTISWVILAAPGAAQEALRARIIYFDLPPFMSQVAGVPAGTGLAFIKHATEGLPVSPDWEFLPIKRLIRDFPTEPMIVFGLGRTAEREKMGLIWVSKMWDSHFVFATLAGHEPIDSLEAGKNAGHITATAGGAPEIMLRSLGFTNLDTAITAHTNVTKLATGHVDAWFDADRTILAHWRLQDQDPARLHLGKSISVLESWIVASPTVPPDVIAALRENLAHMSKSELDTAWPAEPD